MGGRGNNNSIIKQILIVILCFVIAGALFKAYFWYMDKQKAESQKLLEIRNSMENSAKSEEKPSEEGHPALEDGSSGEVSPVSGDGQTEAGPEVPAEQADSAAPTGEQASRVDAVSDVQQAVENDSSSGSQQAGENEAASDVQQAAADNTASGAQQEAENEAASDVQQAAADNTASDMQNTVENTAASDVPAAAENEAAPEENPSAPENPAEGDIQAAQAADPAEAQHEAEENTENPAATDLQTEPAEAAAAENGYEIKGITCWGDDLTTESTSSQASYIARLSGLLAENGYTVPVVNNTIFGGGTLSVMKKAGVEEDVIWAYKRLHEQTAASENRELAVTETSTREYSAEELSRNDLEYLPVIFMGYYGGWIDDPQQLAEQQERILATFPDTDHFIIAAAKPMNNQVSQEVLDTVMLEKWGVHYISLAMVTKAAPGSEEAQAALAQAVFDKMKELGYLG